MQPNTRAASPPLELLDLEIPPPIQREASPTTNAPRWRAAVAIGLVAVLLAGIAWMQRTSVHTPAAAATPAAAVGVPPVGLEGFAEIYVATYLTAEGALRAEELRRFYPAAGDGLTDPAPNRYVSQVAATGARLLAEGYWEVDVAARVLVFDGVGYRPVGLHRYVVPVTTNEGGMAATSYPTRTPSGAAPIPAVATGAAIEDESLTALASGFLGSLLIGEGDVRGYVTAASSLRPITPPPFRTIDIGEISAVKLGDGSLHLAVAATGTPVAGGPLELQYHLVATQEGGAWKITALAAGPPTPSQLDAGEDDGDEPGDA